MSVDAATIMQHLILTIAQLLSGELVVSKVLMYSCPCKFDWELLRCRQTVLPICLRLPWNVTVLHTEGSG